MCSCMVPAPSLGGDQAVADQAPIDQRASRHRLDAAAEVMADGARPPPRMRSAQLEDAGFDRRRHLMGTRLGLGAAVGQTSQAASRVGPQQSCTVWRATPFRRAPSDLSTRTSTAKKVATGGWWTLVSPRTVVQVPEPVSPRYRSRVREVSGRCRSHGVHYEPGPHRSASSSSRRIHAG